ncbi:MAG TPA: peptidase E [Pseudolysinimonas sp.]|jgi:peptidase E
MTAEAPTIVASCAGLDPGGWTDAAYGPLLLHAVRLARVSGRPPRVLHVNTAGGDQRSVEGAEIEAARSAGVEASHLHLFPRRNVPDLRAAVLAADVVWVSGGSLVNLLAVWRAHGLDVVVREAWEAGVVLAGGSAGAVCWFEGGTSSSFGPGISAVTDALGLLPGSLAVHYDSDPARRPAHEAAVASGVLASGWALDEGTGLVFVGGELVEVLSEHPGRAVRRVERDGDHVTESLLEPRLLA